MSDFLDLPDLANEAVGGAAIACNDEFFAEKENLLRAHAGVWKDHVYTDGMPTIDGAPGGTLEGFGILADVLNSVKPIGLPIVAATAHIRSHCFVPAVSAVAIKDPDTDENLYANIDEIPAAESELDEFKCASQNEAHTKITEELCTWIFDRLP